MVTKWPAVESNRQESDRLKKLLLAVTGTSGTSAGALLSFQRQNEGNHVGALLGIEHDVRHGAWPSGSPRRCGPPASSRGRPHQYPTQMLARPGAPLMPPSARLKSASYDVSMPHGPHPVIRIGSSLDLTMALARGLIPNSLRR